ncbi:MAG: RES family NAD+ phosphorylase [Terriglobia bacterium]
MRISTISVAMRAMRSAWTPNRYATSQKLAGELLASGSAGIVCPTVRRPHCTCIACLRPALVTNLRQGESVTLMFRDAHSPPVIGSGN